MSSEERQCVYTCGSFGGAEWNGAVQQEGTEQGRGPGLKRLGSQESARVGTGKSGGERDRESKRSYKQEQRERAGLSPPSLRKRGRWSQSVASGSARPLASHSKKASR